MGVIYQEAPVFLGYGLGSGHHIKVNGDNGIKSAGESGCLNQGGVRIDEVRTERREPRSCFAINVECVNAVLPCPLGEHHLSVNAQDRKSVVEGKSVSVRV